MMRKQFILILVFVWSLSPTFAQKKLPQDLCISANEYRLYQLINTLRTANDMPSINLSASLTHVAHLHIADLNQNHPDTSICNLHSWSDQGKWTACCYQAYVLKQECMWNKPKELTPYKYRGYELAYSGPEEIVADSLIKFWLKVSEVKDMLLNRGNYEKKKWLAVGVGIHNGYAVVWFGQVKDKLLPPQLCDNKVAVIVKTEDKAKSIEKTEKIEKPKKTKIEIQIVKNKTGRYYLIFGSYDRQKMAEKQIKKYISAGFTKAKIVINRDKIRISLSDHPDLQSAKDAKAKLSQKYEDAWIIKF